MDSITFERLNAIIKFVKNYGQFSFERIDTTDPEKPSVLITHPVTKSTLSIELEEFDKSDIDKKFARKIEQHEIQWGIK